MVRQDDMILEGVRPADMASLRALAQEGVVPARAHIAQLHAKGWIDLVNDEPIITLTGRTLLERPPLGLR